MITDSDTFRPVLPELDVSDSYADIVLIRETANARLFRASKAGKYFIIKTMKTSSAMHLSMLKREYELSIPLSHHHIAHVYTYEAHTPVGPGIVMEYVDGRNLAEYIDENPSAENRRRVFTQIAEAVVYIHSKGIIHNDLKPENILVSRVNNDVRLVDFGLSDDDAHYLARTLGCTPTYASPELLARNSDIDARSDIYSLGRIMQLIFGDKYRRIMQRCLESDRDNRFDNVDQLLLLWRKKQRSRYPLIIGISFLILIPVSFFVGRLSTSKDVDRADLNRLNDSLQSARTQALATQQQLDSTRSVLSDKQLAEDRRIALRDSLLHSLNTRLTRIYNDTKVAIAPIPYFDFALNITRANSAKALEIYTEISQLDVDEDMRSVLLSCYNSTWIPYANELTELACAKPHVTNRTMSPEEFQFYQNLLQSGEAYTPYVPGQSSE